VQFKTRDNKENVQKKNTKKITTSAPTEEQVSLYQKYVSHKFIGQKNVYSLIFENAKLSDDAKFTQIHYMLGGRHADFMKNGDQRMNSLVREQITSLLMCNSKIKSTKMIQLFEMFMGSKSMEVVHIASN
jgi:hypothetical protein